VPYRRVGLGANRFIWLQWHGKQPDHAESAEVPLEFHDGRLYIGWPTKKRDEGYLVFQRLDNDQ